AIDSLTGQVNVGAGTYALRLSKTFYRDTSIANIVVLPGECPGVVQTTKVPVVLQTVAGAPPVRSVAVFSTTFLPNAGSQAHLVAIGDADSTLSRAVTWRLNDTTLARIDQSGVVTAKCSVRGGLDTVTATSVADPSVRGSTTFGVGANASC